MIVLEGVDSSGKSTLAEDIMKYAGPKWRIERSRGPGKSPEEINDRLTEYNAMGLGVIFDRHPIISESLYGPIAKRPNWMQPHHFANFWTRAKLLIYCRPDKLELAPQTNLGIDTPEYVSHLTRTRMETIAAYDDFFHRLNPGTYVRYTWANNDDLVRTIMGHVRFINHML